MMKHSLLLLVALASITLLAACRSDDDAPTATGSSSPTIAPTGSEAQTYRPFSAAECEAAALPSVSLRPTASPAATPLPPGTIITPDTAIPETWPTEQIVEVTPPDGTSVHLSDIGVSSGPGITMGVAFEFRMGSGFNEERGLRFGLDGHDVTALMLIVGTADVPQSEAGAHYKERLTLGDHTAGVSYCDNSGKAYGYTWSFSVIA